MADYMTLITYVIGSAKWQRVRQVHDKTPTKQRQVQVKIFTRLRQIPTYSIYIEREYIISALEIHPNLNQCLGSVSVSSTTALLLKYTFLLWYESVDELLTCCVFPLVQFLFTQKQIQVNQNAYSMSTENFHSAYWSDVSGRVRK